jgi:hypothetical protein
LGELVEFSKPYFAEMIPNHLIGVEDSNSIAGF